jgi:hypothetical protein
MKAFVAARYLYRLQYALQSSRPEGSHCVYAPTACE